MLRKIIQLVAEIDNGENPLDKLPEYTGNSPAQNILNGILSIAGLTAIGYVMYASYLLVRSEGSSEKMKKASLTIIYSMIGLTVVAMAMYFINFVAKGLFTK